MTMFLAFRLREPWLRELLLQVINCIEAYLVITNVEFSSRKGGERIIGLFWSHISEDEVAVAPEEYLSHASGRAEDLWEGEALSLKEKKKIPPHGCLLLKCD